MSLKDAVSLGVSLRSRNNYGLNRVGNATPLQLDFSSDNGVNL